MHQSYFLNPASGLTNSQVPNPKAFQKFANLFPNVASNAMAAAVSSLNPFSIESLLAAPAAAQQHQQQQQQRSNYTNLPESCSPNGQKVNSPPSYPGIQSIPNDLYGKFSRIFGKKWD